MNFYILREYQNNLVQDNTSLAHFKIHNTDTEHILFRLLGTR